MAKFFKNGANGDGGFAVVEEGADFGFSRGRHDIFQCIAHDVDGSIGHGCGLGGRVITKDKPGRCSRAGLG